MLATHVPLRQRALTTHSSARASNAQELHEDGLRLQG
jgi:hypothetical protein